MDKQIHAACQIILQLWWQHGKVDNHLHSDFVKKSTTLILPSCWSVHEDATDFLEKYGYAVDNCDGTTTITQEGLLVLMLEDYYLPWQPNG